MFFFRISNTFKAFINIKGIKNNDKRISISDINCIY